MKEIKTDKNETGAIKNIVSKNTDIFGKENYKWMLIGLAVLAVGFLLMAGGNTPENVFDDKNVNGFRKITLAPIVIIAGFVIEVYAIMKKNN